jgi:hypothetical protein
MEMRNERLWGATIFGGEKEEGVTQLHDARGR